MRLSEATKRKLLLGWMGAVVIGVGLQMASVPFGTTILSILIGLPIILGLIWAAIMGQL